MPASPPPISKPPLPKPGMAHLPKPPTASPPKAPSRAAKSFSLAQWDGQGEGKKIVIYAGSGKGKTSLASTAPRAVFNGLDNGGRNLVNPKTGEPLIYIPGIETFEDTRDSMNQKGLFEPGMTYVMDTITKLEEVSEPYIFNNYKTDNGKTVKSLEGYGWGKGYRHALEVMRLFLQDAENLTRQGVNVILLAQESVANVANAEGLDYIADGPKLHHTKQFSSRLEVQEWADHVFRIGYEENAVEGAQNATRGKIVSRDVTRCIYTQAARHYFAKTRDRTLPPIISFSEPADDSLWTFLFKETA